MKGRQSRTVLEPQPPEPSDPTPIVPPPSTLTVFDEDKAPLLWLADGTPFVRRVGF